MVSERLLIVLGMLCRRRGLWNLLHGCSCLPSCLVNRCIRMKWCKVHSAAVVTRGNTELGAAIVETNERHQPICAEQVMLPRAEVAHQWGQCTRQEAAPRCVSVCLPTLEPVCRSFSYVIRGYQATQLLLEFGDVVCSWCPLLVL